MEVVMLGLPRTSEVRSISKAGLSVVTVTFDDDVDLYFARTQVQQRMQDAGMQLPEGIEPMMGPPGTAMGEILQYVVEPEDGRTDSLTLLELTNIQEYTIKPMLRTVPGVASVNTWGGMLQQYQVSADPTRLAGYGLTLHDVEEALRANNANFGGGYLEHAGERLTVRGLGRLGDTASIADVVITTRDDTPIRVRDVARVGLAPRPRYGAVTRDGRGEVVSAVVVMLKDSNGREVVTRIRERLAQIQTVLPAGVRVRVFYDQGEVVERTTRTVFRNLLEGALLVLLVLFAFLRDWRASLLTASVIPLSLLIAFIAMRWFGVTANLMSLGALDFGLIVDGSVVMVENFVRRLEAGAVEGPPERLQSIRRAAFEVGRPILFGVAIIVAVYVPIFGLQGIEGRMFRPMAFTVAAAVLGSLLLALTYVPVLGFYFVGKGARRGEPGWLTRVRLAYHGLLARTLPHPLRVLAIAGGLLTVTVVSAPFLGTEFMPRLDEGYLLIETRRAPSASLGYGIGVSEDVERVLLEFPEVSRVVTNLGRPHEATETMALNLADVYVLFKPRREWRVGSLDDLIPQIDSALSEIPGLDFEFSAPMRMRLDEVVSGVRTDLGVKIFGDSLPLLDQAALDVQRVVNGIRGTEGALVGASEGAMQLELRVDRAGIARHGLSIAGIREAVESGIGGAVATEVQSGRRRVPVVVRLDAPYRTTPEAVGQTLLSSATGGVVTLAQVAELSVMETPEVINHEAGQRFVVVQSNVRGRDLGSFVAAVRRAIARDVKLPPGYFVTYGGQFENQARANRRLAVVVPLVLLVIGGLLHANFGSMRLALIVMLNVPFALIGGIGSLWLRGYHLNLSASVGLIAVFGVAVLNGVVLLTYVGQLRAAGMSLLEAVVQGAEERLRPVLMTALVASVGFLPMALSTSAGGEVQRPLATVVIGGLISSTLLTLLVLPTMYAWVESRRERMR
jgi:cobalt-zinc-cadmium resistance protein CzcA